MAKHQFKWYLHDDYDRYEAQSELVEREGLDPEIAALIAQSRPFYEVTLDCEFDDITKHLTVQAHFQECLTSA